MNSELDEQLAFIIDAAGAAAQIAEGLQEAAEELDGRAAMVPDWQGMGYMAAHIRRAHVAASSTLAHFVALQRLAEQARKALHS